MPPGDPQNRANRAFSESSNDLVRASLVIGLIVCAALVTFGVYSAAIIFERYFQAPPQFPSFVVVLTSFLTIAVILRVGLHEVVDLNKIENPWIKTLAATPSLAIISCLLAGLASFAGLSNLVIAPTTTAAPPLLHFMVANVGVTCDTPNPTLDPKHEASYLLALIFSPKDNYIKDVTDRLSLEIHETDKKQGATPAIERNSANSWSQIDFIRKDSSDQIYRLLKNTRMKELRSDDNWVGYKIPIKGSDQTKFPLPAIFDDYVATYLFLVQPDQKLARTAAAGDPTLDPQILSLDAANESPLSLHQLFDIDIAPSQPAKSEERAQFNFTVHTNSDCWWNNPH